MSMVLLDKAATQRVNRALDNSDESLGSVLEAADVDAYYNNSQFVTIARLPLNIGIVLPSGLGNEDGAVLDENDIDLTQTRPASGTWSLSVAPDIPGVLLIANATGSRDISSTFSGEVDAPRDLVFFTDVGLNLQDPNPATHVFFRIASAHVGTANPNNTFQVVNAFCGGIPITGITARNRLATAGAATTFDVLDASVCSTGRGTGRTLEAPFP